MLVFAFVLAACDNSGGGTATCTVGGNVSGLTGTLVLQNNSVDNLKITRNGNFSFYEFKPTWQCYRIPDKINFVNKLQYK